MPVERTEARTYRETYRCDEPDCHGLVESTGRGMHICGTSSYRHICVHCGKRYDFGKNYPRFVHVPVDAKEGK